MKLTFEKFSGVDKWQVRIKGEFVCYIHKHNNGLFTDTSEQIWSSYKETLVDKILADMGFSSRNHFYKETIAQYLR